MAGITQRRRALQAADNLLNELDIDQESPIDVFDIVSQLGLWLVFNRLDGLLGASVPKGNGGIMLTTQRGPSVQRYTAAHEVGHWLLDIDEPVFDNEDDIFRPTAEREQLAQLFAGQLLMPPPLVFSTCERYGISGDASATASVVYLAARDMGASYEAATRQLLNLDVISQASRDSLLTRKPAQVKTELCHGHRPKGLVDVWPVGMEGTESRISVTEGDEIVIALPENRTTGYRWLTNTEISVRGLRTASPEPDLFADESKQNHTLSRDSADQQSQTRSAADVNRALAKLPGNSGSRRILNNSNSIDHDNPASDPQVGNAPPSALEPLSASVRTIDDRFFAGWARVAPSATRNVRRAIAGRHDVALPEQLLPYSHVGRTGPSGTLDTAMIPASATGERLIALQSSGSGTTELDLSYTSAFDPQAPVTASFHLDLNVVQAPQVRYRRILLESLLDSDVDPNREHRKD